MTKEILKNIKEDVLTLTAHGERLVGKPGHAAARKFLIRRMSELDIEPYKGDSYELPYEMEGTRFVNLIGKISGISKESAPILVGAHYDTYGPHPGADDNAAAIAILFSIIDELKQKKLKRDVIIAIFDAEELPYCKTEAMGSTRFYKDHMMGDVDCAIIMDLVGHDVPIPLLRDLVFFTGMESHSEFDDVVKEVGSSAEVRIVPILNRYIDDQSDYHIFRLNDVPYLFLSCGWWKHYHAPTDTHDKLNFDKMVKIKAMLLDIVEKCDSKDFQNNEPGYDSVETELAFIKKAIPTVASKLLRFDKMESREDVDVLVNRLKGFLQLSNSWCRSWYQPKG